MTNMYDHRTDNRRTELTRTLWQWLHSSPILVVAGLLTFLLFLCAVLIRQMPGQIAAEPAAATRWLLTVSEEYGIWGDALRALGLFDVLHNPLLQLLLAVIALILLIHLGTMVAALWRFWQAPHALAERVVHIGDPLTLPATQPLYRLRQAVPHAPSPFCAQVTEAIRPHYDEVISLTVNHVPYPVDTEETAQSDPTLLPAEVGSVAEFRVLARRHHQRWIWLRPLLPVGLLLALLAVWIILAAGWEITPPFLAPGDDYRATTQRVVFTYPLPAQKAGLTPTLMTPTLMAPTLMAPTLIVEIDDTPQQLLLGESRSQRWGQIAIQANAGPPALLIRSSDETVQLSRPGQTQRTANLGLLFPSLGSEDSVVVDSSVFLRIVRVVLLPEDEQASTNENSGGRQSPLDTSAYEQFLVEVNQRDETKPVQTLYISEQTTATIDVNGVAQELVFIPLPSLAAVVRYQPGIWLLWLAAVLIVVGVAGFRFAPTFLLIQIAPWPTDRTVVVAQSDTAAEIEQLRLFLM
jgi:hypothetical protein